MSVPARVKLVEVGPRDGLQNEAAAIATADKIAFVDRLSDAGHAVIEVSAFVSPKWVPQMADAAEVFAGITRRAGTKYTALVPNLAGLDRAIEAKVDEVAIFAAASETFSRKNINQGIDESLAGYRAVCDRAKAAGLPVRAYVSTAFGCPFEGAVAPAAVAEVSAALIEMGAYEVAVSDTIGIAHPGQVPGVAGRRRRAGPARPDRAALPRHARHRAGQRADGPAARGDDLRRVRGRTRRLPLRARRHRQPRDRGSALHAGWFGDRDRRQASTRSSRRPASSNRNSATRWRRATPLLTERQHAPTANHKDHEGHEDHKDFLGLVLCGLCELRDLCGDAVGPCRLSSSHASNFPSSQQLTTRSAGICAIRAWAMA